MAPDAETPRGHVVAVTLHSWGHAKSACSLLSKIVRQRPVYATFLVGTIVAEQANKEFDFQFLSGVEDHLRNLIRVVPLEAGLNPFDFGSLNESFTEEYKKLFEGARDAAPAREPPQLVILDFFLYNILQCIRAVSGHEVPVYGLESASMAALDMMFGPGGRIARVNEELKRITGKDESDLTEEAFKIFAKADGKLYPIPGLPSMYDHEQMPQKPTLPPGAVVLLKTVTKFLEECDGLVVNTTALLEEEAIKVCKEWIGDKIVICPGPFDYPIIKHPEVVDKRAKDAVDFLDSMIEKYGEASVVYISLGSQFWPSEPEKLWTILDVLMEKNTPFMFAHASPFAVVPDEIKDKIKASGIGYSSKWLPQTTILSHKACGWILTHAGHNSVMEALASGVPMICWPFDADQPVIAANVTFVHNLGYELFEVRTGDGLRPIHRLGDWSPEGTAEAVKREFSETIIKMKGEDGATKRANAQRFRDAFAKLWAAGGENWKEIKRITDILQ